MALREVIEAILRVKDAARFRAGFETAARSVRKFGRDEEVAAAQSELLAKMEAHLEKQTLQLAAVLEICGHAYDEMGDSALTAAVKTEVANKAMKKSGSNAIFLGKSWAFWKDRLSLTRSEIMTTSLTIGAYFSPAIVALGSNFAQAALGGGAVAAGGLSSLLFGLGALGAIIIPTIKGMKKITAAQYQYNIAVDQYGAASIQASRANAHLYAVIQNNGGPAAFRAINNLKTLSNSWKSITAPARRSILGGMNDGIIALQGLLPTIGRQTNRMAGASNNAFQDVIKTLRGGETKKTIESLGRIFSESIGPGVRGFMNLFVILGRVIRASAPWVIMWAQAWEQTTKNWRRGTRDQSRVQAFIDNSVEQFLKWWHLAKSLGTTLRIIWSSSRVEGGKVLDMINGLVDRFNVWLQAASDSGQIDAFWVRYNRSVSDAVWGLSHPIEAINRWLPVIMDTLAQGFATHAPRAAEIFLQAFFNAGGWAQFFTTAYLLNKFGVFRSIGRRVGIMFVTPFMDAFIASFLVRWTGATLAEGSIGAAMTRAGGVSGRVFGAAMAGGIVVGIVAFAPQINNAIRNAVGLDPQSWTDMLGITGPHGLTQSLKNLGGNVWRNLTHPGQIPGSKIPGGASGGVIPPGGTAIVGEMGPEIASAGQRGTQITPLSRNSLHTLSQPDIPNLGGALHISIVTSVQVDRREIARAYDEQAAYTRARRGGA